MPAAQWLEYYSTRFDTVEVNNSFYRLPAEGVFKGWRQKTQGRFVFSVKASRYLTHMKKLRDVEEPIARLFTRVRELGPRLGAVLYQLPPQLVGDSDRLSTFLQLLPNPQKYNHAIEFRHPSWYTPEVFKLLERHDVALCLHDMPGSVSPRMAIGSAIYVRFHGTGARYGGNYHDRTLEAWATWLLQETRQRIAFVYFNNDTHAHAPKNAARLRELMGRGPRVKEQESKVTGQRSKVKGHRSKVKGHRSKVTGHRSKVKSR
jgi:uncharacterized protein YecE (DUF72 family)